MMCSRLILASISVLHRLAKLALGVLLIGQGPLVRNSSISSSCQLPVRRHTSLHPLTATRRNHLHIRGFAGLRLATSAAGGEGDFVPPHKARRALPVFTYTRPTTRDNTGQEAQSLLNTANTTQPAVSTVTITHDPQESPNSKEPSVHCSHTVHLPIFSTADIFDKPPTFDTRLQRWRRIRLQNRSSPSAIGCPLYSKFWEEGH